MRKWFGIGLLAILLVVAGYSFGGLVRQAGADPGLLLSPFGEHWPVVANLLISALAMVLLSALIATLVRPLGAAWMLFAGSAAAVLLGWGWSLASAVTVVIYFAASSLYSWKVAQEMNRRIRFSPESAHVSQDVLLFALALILSVSFFMGFSQRLEAEGYSIPQDFIQSIEQLVEGQLGQSVPEEQRDDALSSFRDVFAGLLNNQLNDLIQPYQAFIPAFFAFVIFSVTMTILRLLALIPAILLAAILGLLKAVGITRVVREAVEAERLILA